NAFEGNAWFNGVAGNAIGAQLYKLGFDGSVTQWTAIQDLNPAPGGSGIFTNFQDALWFAGGAPGQGRQLYKLGNDGSVTKWTALSTGLAGGLDPLTPFVFNDAVWFNGNTASGRQLFKLGADGSVTQWTAMPDFNPTLVSAAVSRLPPNNPMLPFQQDPDSTPSSIFQNAAWLQGTSPTLGTELYKLGADGSVTLWKDINPGPNGSVPYDWATFARG